MWFWRSRKGFNIPYDYINELPLRDESFFIPWLKQKWEQLLPEFIETIELASKFNSRFREFAIENPQNVNQPRFNQDWFPGLDGAMAYTMVNKFKPQKIIEVGSGHSTRFLAQAVRDAELKCHLHSIDPVPRRDIDAICSQITRQTVDKVSAEVLLNLNPKDFLFIDASHIFMPGTDCDYLFNQILPLLKSGVIVHVHDIFLPNEYPNEWRWRGYNEQHALLCLLSNPRYKILMPNAFIRRYHSHLLNKLDFTLFPRAYEASLWLQVV